MLNTETKELLLKLPGVSVVYSGTKKVGGMDTRIPAVVVGVKKKLTMDALQAEGLEPIPIMVENGNSKIPTDVIEVGVIRAPPPERTVRDFKKKSDRLDPLLMSALAIRDRFRPLIPGGVSAIEWCSSGCTLTGWVWSHALMEPVALHNFHCARLKQCKDGWIIQPSPMDGGILDTDVFAQFLAGDVTNPQTDSAISRACGTDGGDVPGDTYATSNIHGLGSYIGYSVPEVGDKIVKSGRTTGITRGSVLGTDASANVDYGSPWGVILKEDLILTTKMLEGGDSSSPMLFDTPNKNSPLVGQGFAGSDEISCFIKIPNIINDPTLSQYELDPNYAFDQPTAPPNGNGEEPINCNDGLEECVTDALNRGDIWGYFTCVINWILCELGITGREAEVEKLMKEKAGIFIKSIQHKLGLTQ